MRLFKLVLPVLAAFMVLPSGNAQAQTYKWCAYYGRHGGMATNCGFSTYRQCMETVSGIGGYCDINPRWSERRAPKGSRY